MAERTRRRKKIEAPFPGLRPFLSGENLIFFGREGQSDELISRLRQNHFLAVLGSSGSGKSSLVRAGLQPDLEGGLMAGVAPYWKIATMRPGDQPIENLADELAKLVINPEDEGYKMISPKEMIMTMLQGSSYGLKEVALGPILKPEENLLVIVDQFEEIFRFNEEYHDPSKLNDAKAFMRLLLEASTDLSLPIYVVITMRSDFLGECPRFDGLAEAINKGQYLVPRLNRAQMREAITSPIAVFGATIAPDLVIRILNDIGDNPDQLPILQHALMRTWDHHCEGDEIVMADYAEIGGLANALNLHAEEIYGELERKGLGKVVEQLFKSLTQLEGDGKGLRRPARLSEICAVTGMRLENVQVVVDAFRAPGRTFLMPPADVPLTPETIIDISHESFMRLWLRLVAWVKEENQSVEEYLRLSLAAADYKLGKVNLWRQPELGIALQWREVVQPTSAWAHRHDTNFDAAMSFLELSLAAWQKEEADKAANLLLQRKSEERQAANQRLKILLVLLGGMLAIVTTALFVAWNQSIRAEHESDRAQQQELIARQKADSLTLAAKVDAIQRDSITDLQCESEFLTKVLQGKLDTISLQSLSLFQQIKATNDQLDSVRKVKQRLDVANSYLAQKNRLQKELTDQANAARDSAEIAKETAEWQADLLNALQFAALSGEAASPELAANLALGAYKLYVARDGDPNDPKIHAALHAALERYRPLVKCHFQLAPILLDYDVTTGDLAILSVNGRLLDMKEIDGAIQPQVTAAMVGTCDTRLLAPGAGRRSVALSDMQHVLHVYSTDNFRELYQMAGHQATVTGAVEIPGKNQWISCDVDGRILRWQMVGGRIAFEELPSQANAMLQAIAIRPDGKQVAVGGRDQIRLFSTDDPSNPKIVELKGNPTALAYSNKGTILAFGLENGVVGYYDLQSDTIPDYRFVHRARVSALAFSTDGVHMASSSFDKTLRLWSKGKPTGSPIVLKGHDSWVTGLAFSKDSQLLYSVSKDKTMRYWYVNSKDIVQALSGVGTFQQIDDLEQYRFDDSNAKGGNRK